MWTPGREDFLLEMCEKIDDEDTTMVDRAEERSERSSEYSDKRAEDANRALKAVEAITAHSPFGQPILIGHHSERRARKGAERIETGMRRAVKMWDTSKYWTDRAPVRSPTPSTRNSPPSAPAALRRSRPTSASGDARGRRPRCGWSSGLSVRRAGQGAAGAGRPPHRQHVPPLTTPEGP